MDISGISKDGNVHDMGSDSRNVVAVSVVFKSKGSESELLEYARRQLVGMKVLEENISQEGGVFYYRARVSSENGIPGSHISAVKVVPVPNFVSFGGID